MLIRAIVYAESEQEALQTAKTNVFDRLTQGPNGISTFDYAVTFDHEPGEHTVAGGDRWGNDIPAAALADSDAGEELIEEGWEATDREFRRNLAVVKLALEHLSDKELQEMADDHDIHLEKQLSEDEIEQAAEEHDVDMLTALFDARYAMWNIGQYRGTTAWLYDGTDWGCGKAIRTQTHLQTVLEERVPDEQDVYVVPADVHY